MSSGNLEGKLVGPHFWPACENCVHSEACKRAPRHRAFPHTWHWGREAASFPEGQLVLRSWVGSSVIGECHTGCHGYRVQPQQLLPPQEKHRRYLKMDRKERELNGRLNRCESQGLYNDDIEAFYKRYDEVLEVMRALRETD